MVVEVDNEKVVELASFFKNPTMAEAFIRSYLSFKEKSVFYSKNGKTVSLEFLLISFRKKSIEKYTLPTNWLKRFDTQKVIPDTGYPSCKHYRSSKKPNLNYYDKLSC